MKASDIPLSKAQRHTLELLAKEPGTWVSRIPSVTRTSTVDALLDYNLVSYNEKKDALKIRALGQKVLASNA